MKESAELVKYMTQRLISYFETPSDERRRNRETAKSVREPWLAKWFGLAPYGMLLWWRARKSRQAASGPPSIQE